MEKTIARIIVVVLGGVGFYYYLTVAKCYTIECLSRFHLDIALMVCGFILFMWAFFKSGWSPH